jgi:uncharacterized repeat protein (TIGR01451 family)
MYYSAAPPKVYDGPEELKALLVGNRVRPLGLASGDFDEDGVPELVTAYSGRPGGILVIYRGNVDSIYPNTLEARERALVEGRPVNERPSPFLAPGRILSLSLAPEFVAAGDFDADGHCDVLVAARGGNVLMLLKGNGRGGFASPASRALPGAVTAMAVGDVNRADGLPDAVVAVNGSDGPAVLVLEAPVGAFRASPERFELPEPASALAIGRYGNDYTNDLAIGAGARLILVHGRDRRLSSGALRQAKVPPAGIDTLVLESPITAMAASRFAGHRRQDLAVVLNNGTLERVSTRGDGTSLAKRVPVSWRTSVVAEGVRAMATGLTVARVRAGAGEDLVALSSAHQLRLLSAQTDPESSATATGGGRTTALTVSPTSAGIPVAVLPMRLNQDAFDDLVILHEGESQPADVITVCAHAFAVDSAGTERDCDTTDDKCAIDPDPTTPECEPGGRCTLMAAVQQSNASSGADCIEFAIPGGAATIPTAGYSFTDPVTVDGSSPGSTQPGTELRGPGSGFGIDLTSGASASVIHGLVINGTNAGINIGAGSSDNRVDGNWIGTDRSGNAPRPNYVDIAIFDADRNVIGGTAESARNVISGATDGFGVFLLGGSENRVEGNYIGTDVTGRERLRNSWGIAIENFGSAPAEGNVVEGNVISGNKEGIYLGPAATVTGNKIRGNLFGTDRDGEEGSSPLGNETSVVIDGASENTVGGTSPDLRNVISGSGSGPSQGAGYGVAIFSTQGPSPSHAIGNVIQGNFIGTDITGLKALGNVGWGVILWDDVGENHIGGNSPEARNVISGNGVGVQLGGVDTELLGNYIGTDKTGRREIPNGQGVALFASDVPLASDRGGFMIGGLTAQESNVISGNSLSGIYVKGSFSKPSRILGNLIGTTQDGEQALGNAEGGIFIRDSSAIMIGGTETGARNVIAANGEGGWAGITVLESPAHGIRIQRNVIGVSRSGATLLPNGGSGIELGGDGTTPNDVSFTVDPIDARVPEGNSGTTDTEFDVHLAVDEDDGANGLQNFPVLTFASAQSAIVEGTLQSRPSTNYTIELFENEICHTTGYGEGGRFLTETSVTTDATGTATFRIEAPVTSGAWVTATATDPAGNTSEFSRCLRVGSVLPAVEPPSLRYWTSDGTARAGLDYLPKDGVLTFDQDTGVDRTIAVPVIGDTIAEDDERFFLNFEPSNATIPVPFATATIVDDDGSGGACEDDDGNPVTVSITDAAVVEGDAGVTNAVFYVILSGRCRRTVSVGFTTVDGTAHAPADYGAFSGTLFFFPGTTIQGIAVPVYGDILTEGNEYFLVDIGVVNAGIGRAPGVGRILDDDVPGDAPSVSIDNVTITEGNTGSANAVFTLSLSPPSLQEVRVDYGTRADSATPGTDFTPASGTLVFPPNTRMRTISVPVLGDVLHEGTEWFHVDLTNAVNGTIASGGGLGVIVDDDSPPSVTIRDVSVREGNQETTDAVFTLNLSAVSGVTARVAFETQGDTATAGADFIGVSRPLDFPPGTTTQTVTVPVNGDTVSEGTETFRVVVRPLADAVILDDTAVGSIVNDDSGTHLLRDGMADLFATAFDGTTYVAAGAYGDIWTSTDGVAWTRRFNPDPRSSWLRAITFGAGGFVVLGECCGGVTGSGAILLSPDGRRWTLRDSGPAANGQSLLGVAWGNGTYVAVGSSGTIITSPELDVWTRRTSPVTSALNAVTFGGGVFVAVGAARTVLRSIDGSTWAVVAAPGTVPTNASLNAVTWTGTQFVAVGSGSVIMTSADGSTWTRQTAPAGSYTGVTAGPGVIAAIRSTGIVTSIDGVTWTPAPTDPAGPGVSRTLRAVAFGGEFLAVGSSGTLFSSPDGTTQWNNRTLAGSRLLAAVASTPTVDCAVGANGAVARSTDGTTWVNQAGLPPPSGTTYDRWNALANGAGVFVAVGAQAAVMTSADCATWTDRNPGRTLPVGASSADFLKVTRGGGLFVAVGQKLLTASGNFVPMIATSPDGIAWTQGDVTTPPDGHFRSLSSVAFGGGLFVASGVDLDTGAPFNITSPDGLDWTLQVTPFDVYENLQDIAYRDGTFIGVGARIWSSTDGVTWMLRRDSGSYLSAVAAFDGGVVAVGYGGAMSTSSDGLTWTDGVTATTHSLAGVAFSTLLDAVVAVGDSAILALTSAVPPPPEADLSVTQSDSPDPVPGLQVLNYTISVANAGPNPATSLVVQDSLPTGTTFSSAGGSGWSCGEAAGLVTCTRTSLDVEPAPAISIQVTVPDTAGTLTNTASVIAAEADPVAGDNTSTEQTTVTAPLAAELWITKTADAGMVGAGQAFSYAIVAGNDGPSAVVGAEVTDNFPPSLATITWACAATAGSSCAASGSGNINDSVTLATGGQATYTATVVVATGATGSIVNTATIAGPGTLVDPDATNNSASTSTDIEPPIFADGFESGDLSAWAASSTDGSDLSAAPEAGLAGSGFGLKAVVNDGSDLFVQDDTPAHEDSYRARFYIDPQTFDPGEARHISRVQVFSAFQQGPRRRLIEVVLRRLKGQYSLMGLARLDGGGQAKTGFFPISPGPHGVELAWRRASGPAVSDGVFELWIDGQLKSTLAGLANSMGSIDMVRLGVMGVRAAANGTLFLDEFESRRFSYIGPKP